MTSKNAIHIYPLFIHLNVSFERQLEDLTEYQVVVDSSQLYEFVLSAVTYATDMKINPDTTAWRKSVRKKLPQHVHDSLVSAKVEMNLRPLILICTASPERTRVPEFINWFENQSSGDLYDLFNPHMNNLSQSIPSLTVWQQTVVDTLRLWHEHYFTNKPPEFQEMLDRDAAIKRHWLSIACAQDAVERILRGIRIEYDEALHTVLLIPSAFSAPENIRVNFNDMMVLYYPKAFVETQASDDDLIRMAKAIADDARLKVLRSLGQSARRFSDIARRTGISKSTLHNHLVTLRDAGFIRIHAHLNGYDRYSLRIDSFALLEGMLAKMREELH